MIGWYYLHVLTRQVRRILPLFYRALFRPDDALPRGLSSLWVSVVRQKNTQYHQRFQTDFGKQLGPSVAGVI